MTGQFSSFTILSQYHFAQIHSLWLSVFDSFEVFCLAAPLQPSIHLSPSAFPSVQFGFSELTNKAIWDLLSSPGTNDLCSEPFAWQE